jgi:hypothetical protein
VAPDTEDQVRLLLASSSSQFLIDAIIITITTTITIIITIIITTTTITITIIITITIHQQTVVEADPFITEKSTGPRTSRRKPASTTVLSSLSGELRPWHGILTQ